MGAGKFGLASSFHLICETPISPVGQKVLSVMERASICIGLELVTIMTQMSNFLFPPISFLSVKKFSILLKCSL